MPIEFNKTVSVTGGAAINLLTLMQANGFPAALDPTGSLIGTYLRFHSPSDQALFTGSSSSVNDTTGDSIDAGSYDSQEATGMMGDVIDPSQKYLYLATTGNVGILYRGK
jgi:hypothetical protein